jgi:hypothetical protein
LNSTRIVSKSIGGQVVLGVPVKGKKGNTGGKKKKEGAPPPLAASHLLLNSSSVSLSSTSSVYSSTDAATREGKLVLKKFVDNFLRSNAYNGNSLVCLCDTE